MAIKVNDTVYHGNNGRAGKVLAYYPGRLKPYLVRWSDNTTTQVSKADTRPKPGPNEYKAKARPTIPENTGLVLTQPKTAERRIFEDRMRRHLSDTYHSMNPGAGHPQVCADVVRQMARAAGVDWSIRDAEGTESMQPMPAVDAFNQEDHYEPWPEC